MASGPERDSVVVTGSSTGIGRACALHLDGLGWRVFAGVRRDQDAASLRAEASDNLTPIMIDVTDPASIDAAVEAVGDELGDQGLWGLVNNAGIVYSGPLEFLSLDSLRQQFEVNVFGQVAVTQAFLPLLRQGRGRVVNVGSISGKSAMPLLGPYAASKFALEAITDAMRVELRPFGIKVSILEPSTIATPIWEKSTAKAEELSEQFPDQCHELYGECMTAVRQLAEGSATRGVDPSLVVEKVVHALTARRPKARYPVGSGARQLSLLEKLPTRLRDWLIWREIAKRTNHKSE